MRKILDKATNEWAALVGPIAAMAEPLERLADALWACWRQGGKLLVAGNGGSAADAMHLAEELVVRFRKNRRPFAAIALCDPTVLSCAGNDFGFDFVFSRQVEALGKPGDVLLVFTTSGDSPNLLRAIEAARERGLVTAAMLGRGGGAASGRCDIELMAPPIADTPHRVQEVHKLLFHCLCEWIDERA